MEISKFGIVWFREAEYMELRKMFTDGDGLPSTYSEWLVLAESGLKKLQSAGHDVIKAYVHLSTFPQWCEDRGIEINAKARTRYANEYAYKHIDNGES